MGENSRGNLIKDELQVELRKIFGEDVNVYEYEEKYITYLEEKGRVYTVTKDGEIIEIDTYENYKIAKYMEEIRVAHKEAKENNSENQKIFNEVKNKLNYPSAEYKENTISMIITPEETMDFTLLDDVTVLYGRYAYLNIAEGIIELYKTGYKQNAEELMNYEGDYVITGTSTTNMVKVMDEGVYNITIKDLKIDLREMSQECPFNANEGSKTNNCFVNVNIKGNNYLYAGGSAPGLGFAIGIPNINGETTGSTLTIGGDGYLDVIGGAYAAGIGSGYGNNLVNSNIVGDVNNIIINSGNIKVKPGSNGCAIGGAHGKCNVNNIIINGGNIEAIASNRFGIGATGSGVADNIIINGGNIIATGGEYGGAIGGYTGSGKITINGGVIQTKTTYKYSAIGNACLEVEINGGTVITNATKFAGISCDTGGNIKITGGSILTKGIVSIGEIVSSNVVEEKVPTDGTNNLYLTTIQLKDINEKTKVKSLVTSDNIAYGIKDMYTGEDGKLYLYLPEGERTITIETEKKKYSGKVKTEQTNSVVALEIK